MVSLSYDEYKSMKSRIELLELLAEADEDIALKKLNDLEKNIYLLEDNPYLGITPRYLVFKRQGYQVLILEKDLIFYKINKDKKTNYYLCGRRSTSGLSEYYSRIVNCLLKNQKFIE